MPYLTTQDIVQINEFLNTVKDTLTQWAQPGSRFYELDAYSFLGGFLPCGRVPKADDEIFSANQRIQNVNDVLTILASAKDIEPEEPSESDDSGCEELIVAINNLAAKLDFTTIINNALTAFLPVLIAALDPKFTSINTNIDDSTSLLSGNINSVNNNVNNARDGINDTRIELREARERLIEIQGQNRGIEILQRINDTRIELREARERLIVIEDCVCPRIQPGTEFDVDALVARLMVDINAALDKQAILIFDSLYDQLIALEGRLNLKIDAPAWLPEVNRKLDLIITLLAKLDEIINFLRDLDLYLRTKLDKIALDIATLINIANNIDATVSSIFTALQLLRNIVNEIDNNIDILRGLINNISAVVNSILNEVRSIDIQSNNDLSQILFRLGQITTQINNLSDDIDRLRPPNLAGNTTSIGCLTTDSYSYSGNGFIGLSSQIGTISSQLNKLHSELCPTIEASSEVIEGELVSVTCEDTETLISTPFSGTGLKAIVAALELNSTNNVAIHKEICKKKEEEPNCFVMVPSDVDEELNYPNQLIINWREDNNKTLKESSIWTSTVPLPISGLNWDTHFENLRWVRGNITGRWYLKGSTARLGGYFNTEQDALNTLNQLRALTTLEPKTTSPRITKGGSTFITSTGVVTRPYKVVLANIVDGKPIPVACYTPNNKG